MSFRIVDFHIAGDFRIALAHWLECWSFPFLAEGPQAVVTKEYAEGKPRKAETLFGWNRYAVTLYVRFEKSFQSRRFLKPMQSLATFRQLTNGPRTVEAAS